MEEQDEYETEQIPDLVVATVHRIAEEHTDKVIKELSEIVTEGQAPELLQKFCDITGGQRELLAVLPGLCFMVMHMVSSELLADAKMEVTRGTKLYMIMELTLRICQEGPDFEVTNLAREKPN